MDYREAIETVQDIHDVAETRVKSGDARGVVYINPNRLTDLKDAISAMQELQAIHNNGISLERLKDIDFRKQVVEHINYMECIYTKDELEEFSSSALGRKVLEAVKRQPTIDVPDTNVGKQTNADRIRSMTDEELADFIERFGTFNQPCNISKGKTLEWLQSEVEE